MPGSASFASGSGATKRGITNWSSESRVSRTSPRSGAVRRKRRSRVTGNELTVEEYAAAGAAARLRATGDGSRRMQCELRRVERDRLVEDRSPRVAVDDDGPRDRGPRCRMQGAAPGDGEVQLCLDRALGMHVNRCGPLDSERTAHDHVPRAIGVALEIRGEMGSELP